MYICKLGSNELKNLSMITSDPLPSERSLKFSCELLITGHNDPLCYNYTCSQRHITVFDLENRVLLTPGYQVGVQKTFFT